MRNRNKMEILENVNKKFFDFWSCYYDAGIVGKWLLNVVTKTLDSVSINDNAVILDVGTGTGNLLYLIEKQNKNLELYGTDISEEMLIIARKKLNNAHLIKISVVNLDRKFNKEFFDYIFVIDAFHHFPKQDKVINNFYKILKSNGKLIITELDFGFVFNYFFHIIEPGNEWLYTKKEIKHLFLNAGFFVEKQNKIGLFSFVTIGLKNKLNKNYGG